MCLRLRKRQLAPVITISGSGANAGFARLYNVDVFASDCSFVDSQTTPYLFWVYCFIKDSKQFTTYANEINRMMKYLERDDISDEDRNKKDAIIAISDELKKKKKHIDNVDLMVQINGILGEYIMIEQESNNNDIAKRFDISRIDFDLLRREFAKTKKKNLLITDLDELIQTRLDSMLKENPSRVDYYERYQTIIDEYNNEQDRANIEKTFMDLMNLANSMNQEEKRYVREGFTSDEELSL